MTEALLGRTTLRMVGRPRNTFVWVTALGGGLFRIRIPQTLLEQSVDLASVEPA